MGSPIEVGLSILHLQNRGCLGFVAELATTEETSDAGSWKNNKNGYTLYRILTAIIGLFICTSENINKKL
jgi:hypothetical protein